MRFGVMTGLWCGRMSLFLSPRAFPSLPFPSLILQSRPISPIEKNIVKFKVLIYDCRTKPAKKNIEESREFMVEILANEENPDIDKFAIMLKAQPTNPSLNPTVASRATSEQEEEVKGVEPPKKDKMIGFVGTNRFKAEGMEVGYCMNIAFWNRGYATEAFGCFLELFWGLEGLFLFLSLFLLPGHFILIS